MSYNAEREQVRRVAARLLARKSVTYPAGKRARSIDYPGGLSAERVTQDGDRVAWRVLAYQCSTYTSNEERVYLGTVQLAVRKRNPSDPASRFEATILRSDYSKHPVCANAYGAIHPGTLCPGEAVSAGEDAPKALCEKCECCEVCCTCSAVSRIPTALVLPHLFTLETLCVDNKMHRLTIVSEQDQHTKRRSTGVMCVECHATIMLDNAVAILALLHAFEARHNIFGKLSHDFLVF